MYIEVGKSRIFASSGGRPHVKGQPWILFLHGAGQSHLTWSQQVRAFAYDGYNVLAVDLPGHGNSEGPPLLGAENMTDWVIKLLDSVEIDKVHLVNHSMGGIISLELASRYPERVASIVFIATAMTIAVGEILIEWSKNDHDKAINMMTSLSHGPQAHLHDNSVPGASLIGSGVQIMNGNGDDALSADLISCKTYTNGTNAASRVDCPTLCLISRDDKMVGAKFGALLHENLSNSEIHYFENAGHMLPGERPREINDIARKFFSSII